MPVTKKHRIHVEDSDQSDCELQFRWQNLVGEKYMLAKSSRVFKKERKQRKNFNWY